MVAGVVEGDADLFGHNTEEPLIVGAKRLGLAGLDSKNSDRPVVGGDGNADF